jgi:histidinol phosphatase-like PHP family hydrolase
VDIHTHSLHSDGLGTVEENAGRVAACGLDFFFAADHASLNQKKDVARLVTSGR